VTSSPRRSGLDLEGIVAKRKKDPYAPGTVWYKIKESSVHADGGQGGTVPSEGAMKK
jgi:hypothetical protein